MVKEVLKTNDGSKDNAEAVKPIADIDVLIQRVRPGEKQCNSFKNELKSFDSDDKLMDKLKKGQFVDFPADSGRQNRSFIAYAGLDPLAMKKGTYGDRPDLRPGKGDGRLAEAPPWEGTVKEVFGKAAMAIVRNHVEIGDLNLQKIMAEKGLPKDAPVTLLNFDAHSDIYSGRGAVDGKENIGNWVNVMLQKNPNITDFYWVMPNDFKDKPEYSHYYYSGKNHDRILADSTPDRTVYINNKTGDFSWDVKPDDFSESDYRTVGIHKRALQDMPDSQMADLEKLTAGYLKLKRYEAADYYSKKLLELSKTGGTGVMKLSDWVVTTECWVSTKEYHQGWHYKLVWLFETRGVLTLGPSKLDFQSKKVNFTCAPADIVSIEIKRHPLWMKPVPMRYISLTIDEHGVRHTFYLTPSFGQTDTVFDCNRMVDAWYQRLQRIKDAMHPVGSFPDWLKDVQG